MHIAVLVYGRLNKCIEHYQNIIETIGKHNKIDFYLSSDNSPLIDKFVEQYKPIAYINDQIHYNLDLGNYPGKRDETNIHNMTCHFINKHRVFSLFESHVNTYNIKYDVVISLRIDLIFRNPFTFNNIQDNTIYIPNCYDYVDNAINDQIAYGSFNTMKKYSSIITNVLYFLENKMTIPHPESINLTNINYYKLKIVRFNLNYYLDR